MDAPPPAPTPPLDTNKLLQRYSLHNINQPTSNDLNQRLWENLCKDTHFHNHTLRLYQQTLAVVAARTLLTQGRGILLSTPTGSGKTLMVLRLMNIVHRLAVTHAPATDTKSSTDWLITCTPRSLSMWEAAITSVGLGPAHHGAAPVLFVVRLGMQDAKEKLKLFLNRPKPPHQISIVLISTKMIMTGNIATQATKTASPVEEEYRRTSEEATPTVTFPPIIAEHPFEAIVVDEIQLIIGHTATVLTDFYKALLELAVRGHRIMGVSATPFVKVLPYEMARYLCLFLPRAITTADVDVTATAPNAKLWALGGCIVLTDEVAKFIRLPLVHIHLLLPRYIEHHKALAPPEPPHQKTPSQRTSTRNRGQSITSRRATNTAPLESSQSDQQRKMNNHVKAQNGLFSNEEYCMTEAMFREAFDHPGGGSTASTNEEQDQEIALRKKLQAEKKFNQQLKKKSSVFQVLAMMFVARWRRDETNKQNSDHCTTKICVFASSIDTLNYAKDIIEQEHHDYCQKLVSALKKKNKNPTATVHEQILNYTTMAEQATTSTIIGSSGSSSHHNTTTRSSSSDQQQHIIDEFATNEQKTGLFVSQVASVAISLIACDLLICLDPMDTDTAQHQLQDRLWRFGQTTVPHVVIIHSIPPNSSQPMASFWTKDDKSHWAALQLRERCNVIQQELGLETNQWFTHLFPFVQEVVNGLKETASTRGTLLRPTASKWSTKLCMAEIDKQLNDKNDLLMGNGSVVRKAMVPFLKIQKLWGHKTFVPDETAVPVGKQPGSK